MASATATSKVGGRAAQGGRAHVVTMRFQDGAHCPLEALPRDRAPDVAQALQWPAGLVGRGPAWRPVPALRCHRGAGLDPRRHGRVAAELVRMQRRLRQVVLKLRCRLCRARSVGLGSRSALRRVVRGVRPCPRRCGSTVEVHSARGVGGAHRHHERLHLPPLRRCGRARGHGAMLVRAGRGLRAVSGPHRRGPQRRRVGVGLRDHGLCNLERVAGAAVTPPALHLVPKPLETRMQRRCRRSPKVGRGAGRGRRGRHGGGARSQRDRRRCSSAYLRGRLSVSCWRRQRGRLRCGYR